MSDREELEGALRRLGELDGARPAAASRDLAGAALHGARLRARWRAAGSAAAAATAVLALAVGTQLPLTAASPAHGPGPAPVPPAPTSSWDRPRVNVLLLGGDSGSDRVGIRPDSIVVASVDPRTGDTVLVSVPRALQRVPFPPGTAGAKAYPDGFFCLDKAAGTNTECLLNALWTWGDDHPSYYPGDKHPGLTAVTQGVEQVTGLSIDDYVVLDLRGFAALVDAVGGVDVTVTQRLPIGGNVGNRTASSWLEPGRQHLDGYHALWFARSRWTSSDFDRMRRQRCLLSALIRQVDGPQMLTRWPQVAAALQRHLLTSVPLADLSRWVELSGRVRQARVTTLVLDQQVIDLLHPDIPAIHRLVARALDGTAPSGPVTAPGTGSAAGPKGTGTASGAAGTAQDAGAVCAG